MRKMFGILNVLLALALLSGCGSQPAADSAITPPADYPALFQRAVSSDGAAAEDAANELAAAYDSDAEGLLSAMGQCTAEELDAAAQLLVYGKSYGDLDAFQQDIRQRLAQDDPVLTAVQQAIDRYNSANSGGSGQSGSAVDDPSLFNEETIRDFVTRHDYTSGPDESFFTLLADVYRQDPETLAAAVEGLDDSQLDYIARGIAYDIINHGSDTSGKEPDSGDPFIAMVEAAIADKRNGNLNSFSS